MWMAFSPPNSGIPLAIAIAIALALATVTVASQARRIGEPWQNSNSSDFHLPESQTIRIIEKFFFLLVVAVVLFAAISAINLSLTTTKSKWMKFQAGRQPARRFVIFGNDCDDVANMLPSLLAFYPCCCEWEFNTEKHKDHRAYDSMFPLHASQE